MKLACAPRCGICLTLTNYAETIPISMIDMAALGLPIAATNAGRIPDLLHEP
jgi:hypothetical protein